MKVVPAFEEVEDRPARLGLGREALRGAICKALDLHPLEFCRMVFGEPKQRSPLLQRLEGVLGLLKR